MVITILKLVTNSSYFASIDLKDEYLLLAIQKKYKNICDFLLNFFLGI